MGLTRTKPMRRSRMVRHSRPDQPPASAVMAAVGRAWRPQGVCCEPCGVAVVGERGLDWDVHHRRGRDSRADTHSCQNLLVCCRRCHESIHSHPADSIHNGWLISRNARPVIDPLTVPVLIERGSRYVYFTADGGYSDNPPETP